MKLRPLHGTTARRHLVAALACTPALLLPLHGATPRRTADFPTPRLARALPPERIAQIITNLPPGRNFRVPTPGLRPWREGRHYSLGDSTTWQRGIYYCIQPHTAHTGAGWSPDRVPALWRLIRMAGEVIPAWRQPLGAHDAYQQGDVVMHNGHKWRSTINNNVWAPGVYGWEKIE